MNKWPILLAVLSLGLLGQDRELNHKRSILRVTPHTVEWGVEQDGATHIYRQAAAEMRVLTISADEMKFDEDTGEIEPRGNVRVKLESVPLRR
jgi:hypothetical protein